MKESHHVYIQILTRTAVDFLPVFTSVVLLYISTGGNCSSFSFPVGESDYYLCAMCHNRAYLNSVKSSTKCKPKLLVLDYLNLNRELLLSVFMQCHQIQCTWSVWRYYQDLLMPLTISVSLYLLCCLALPPLWLPVFFLSAAFLLSWNCNRRTKWLANPFLCFFELVMIHMTYSSQQWDEPKVLSVSLSCYTEINTKSILINQTNKIRYSASQIMSKKASRAYSDYVLIKAIL